MIQLPVNLRYVFLMISIIFSVFFILTFPKKILRQYTIDAGFIHITAHTISWIVLFIAYYIL